MRLRNSWRGGSRAEQRVRLDCKKRDLLKRTRFIDSNVESRFRAPCTARPPLGRNDINCWHNFNSDNINYVRTTLFSTRSRDEITSTVKCDARSRRCEDSPRSGFSRACICVFVSTSVNCGIILSGGPKSSRNIFLAIAPPPRACGCRAQVTTKYPHLPVWRGDCLGIFGLPLLVYTTFAGNFIGDILIAYLVGALAAVGIYI